MDLRLLTQADLCLSKCGKPTVPPGLSVVYLPRGIEIQTSQSTAGQSVITKEVKGDTVWELRAIQALLTSTQALYIQVQLPDGKFLFNTLLDITQVGGYGSNRFLFTKPLACPPGTRISVTFNTTLPAAASAQEIALLFEGADRYYLKGERLVPCPEAFAAELPRYLGNPNQNLMAPSWMQGYYPIPPVNSTPEEPYTYASGPFGQAPGTQAITIGSTLSTTVQINIDQNYEFECRRLLVAVTAADTVTAGSILGRVRDGSGYALTDDYIDLAKYLGSAPWPKGWTVKPGSAIYIDLILVDAAGTGNVNFQCFAEGIRRPLQ